MNAKPRKKGKFIKIFFAVFFIAIIVTGFWAYSTYQKIFSPNTHIYNKKKTYIYIKRSDNFETVKEKLYKNNFIIDKASFEWVANKKNYPKLIKSGRYKIKNAMSNNELINLLRSGKQTAINLTFNNIRTPEQLAGKLALQIEADSSEVIALLNNENFLKKYNFSKLSVMSMFIPNTYKVYWNTSARKLFKRMNREYKKFWNTKRKAKAEKIGLSPYKVSILASIVQAEQSQHNDEKPIVAGLYINRLNRSMPLQSDPTLVYALGDFTIKRVLNKHKEIDSPFNTYKNLGLPPAPINLPEISSIDAVLNYEKHKYLYMCAKDDFSGYHYFAKSNRQHNIYARRYHNALNKKKIYK